MRIVFLRSNPVAPYPRLEKAANSLKKRGHWVHVLAWDRNKKYKQQDSILKLSNCNVTITRFGIPGAFGGGIKKNLLPLIKFQLKILFWLFKNRKSYDVIHAYDFDTGFTALKCAKLLRKKIVYDIPDYYIDSHNLDKRNLGKYVKKLEDNIINKADAVIICTEKRIQQISGTKPKKLVIIHNSPQKVFLKNPKTDREFNKKRDKLKIAYVGILAESRFIKEIAKVVRERSDCEFHIAGFGELENYFKELSKKYSNINFYGKITYDETIELEKNCDVITAVYDPKIPNHYYAAPNKFYEALMLGKPLIMAENTGMSEIVIENEIGEVIEYSTDSLNEAIDRLISKVDKWELMAKKGALLYKDYYAWEIMEKRLISLYDNL